MEEKGPLGGFALNLLCDMERLSLGSAAGTEPIVLEERLFGRAMEDTPGGGVTAFPVAVREQPCQNSPFGEERGKKDQEGEEIHSFIKASYFKAVQLKCSPLV